MCDSAEILLFKNNFSGAARIYMRSSILVHQKCVVPQAGVEMVDVSGQYQLPTDFISNKTIILI